MGFISEFTYSQKVNSSKGVEVMIKVGKTWVCTYKGNSKGGLSAWCAYSQKVNSCKSIRVMVKVG